MNIEDPTRPRGIFSERMRRYLIGENIPLTPQTERKLRHDIRQRVEHALLDAALLHQLEERDREQIMDPIDGDIERGIGGLLGFLYKAARDSPRDTEDQLAEWLAGGVTQATSSTEPETKRVREASVDLHIEPPEEIDLQELVEKLDQGAYEEISGNERLVLLWMAERARTAGISWERRTLGFDVDELLAALADDVEDDMGLKDWLNLPPEAYTADEE